MAKRSRERIRQDVCNHNVLSSHESLAADETLEINGLPEVRKALLL